MSDSIAIRSAFILSALCLAGAAQAADYGSNLIVNGNAEAGITGWSSFAGVTPISSVEYGSNWVLPTQPGPVDRGAMLFVVGSGVDYAASFQTMSLASFASGIATGQVGYTLTGYLGGWQSQADNAVLTARFFDSGSNVIGNAVIGPVTPSDRNNQTGLFSVTSTGFVPVAATSVQFVLELTRLNSSDNDGYADNLSFALTSAVPEPGSVALMLAGLGLLGFVAARHAGRGKR